MTSEKTRTDFLHRLARLIECVVLLITICCPSAFAERRVDSDGYVINDSLRIEEPLGESFRAVDTWDYSEQFFFLDRDMTEDVGETKPWTEKDKTLVKASLRYVHRKWPELFTNLGHKVCLYRSDKIANPRRKDSTRDTVIASTKYRTITFSNLFFKYPDTFEVSTLVHELVHVIDTGALVSYSPAWVAFVRSAKLSNGNDGHDEILAEYLARYFTANTQARSTEFEDKIYKPFFQTRNEQSIRYSSLYIAGLKAMSDRDFSSAISFLERASFENQSCPMSCLNLTCAYLFKGREEDALKAAAMAERQFKALGFGFENRDLFHLETVKVKIYLHLNQTVNAGALVEKLLKIDPKDENVISLAKRVQEQRIKAQR